MLLYWILLPIVWPLLHILWRIEVVGKENIPRGRAHVIASNHLSDLDPVYILEAVFSWKRYTILAKQELFKNPLIGWFLSCMGAVPIDRGKGDMDTVKQDRRTANLKKRCVPDCRQCRCRHGALPHYLRYAG